MSTVLFVRRYYGCGDGIAFMCQLRSEPIFLSTSSEHCNLSKRAVWHLAQHVLAGHALLCRGLQLYF